MDTQSRCYRKVKRDRVDYCNICGQRKELTYDHIPPKCCFNSTKTVPLETISGQAENYNQFCTQNGLKYRSICAQCNSGLLAKYDKALEDFVGKIKDALTCDDYHVRSTISIRANAIAKSVCGHILAMKDSYDGECIIDKRMRDYVLQPNMIPPKGSSLLLRYYPYSTVFLMRDAVILKAGVKTNVPAGVISVLSSFPVAFILCDDSTNCGMIDLFECCSNIVDEETTIEFDLRSAFFPGTSVVRPPRWPCNISDSNYGVAGVMCSRYAVEDSVYANRSTNDMKAKLFSKR